MKHEKNTTRKKNAVKKLHAPKVKKPITCYVNPKTKECVPEKEAGFYFAKVA